jgi:hypothetical protein
MEILINPHLSNRLAVKSGRNPMKKSGTRLVRHTALFLILFGAAAPLGAHVLDVCNKGTVPVVVVTAMKNSDLLRGPGKNYWAIRSTAVASGDCKSVYSDLDGDGAYLGFGFEDAQGQWGSGKVAEVPDFGVYVQWFQTWPILSRGKGTIAVCVPRVDTAYTVADDPKTDCATMRLTPSNGAQEVHGPFLPITSSLYFKTLDASCLGDMGAQGPCHYYLNISPSRTSRELHAAQGTGGGTNAEPPMTDAQVFKALGDMVAKYKEKNPAPASPPPAAPPPPKREPTITMVAPAHDGYAIKFDPSLNAVLASREQEKWKSPMFTVSAYEPKWIGQTLVLKGTVSRVEVERDGEPKWVHIYFKESPDATVTGCSPFPSMLRKMFGNDLSTLVGKTIEMAGQVEKFCDPKISIRIVDPAQIRLVN